MKTREDNLDKDAQSVRVFLKEFIGKVLPNVENTSFTREDYLQSYNEVNNKHSSHRTTRDSSKYDFIVVWQKYE